MVFQLTNIKGFLPFQTTHGLQDYMTIKAHKMFVLFTSNKMLD